jgi:hypothetical protein
VRRGQRRGSRLAPSPYCNAGQSHVGNTDCSVQSVTKNQTTAKQGHGKRGFSISEVHVVAGAPRRLSAA